MASLSENTDGGLITAKLLLTKVMTTCEGGAIGSWVPMAEHGRRDAAVAFSGASGLGISTLFQNSHNSTTKPRNIKQLEGVEECRNQGKFVWY